MRSSSAAMCSSSRRVATGPANVSANSPNAGPRHNPAPRRTGRPPAPDRPRPVPGGTGPRTGRRRVLRRRRPAGSRESASTPAGRWGRAIGAGAPPSCAPRRPAPGGCSPQTVSTIGWSGTTRRGCRSSVASSARGRCPDPVRVPDGVSTSSGPKTRNNTSPAHLQACWSLSRMPPRGPRGLQSSRPFSSSRRPASPAVPRWAVRRGGRRTASRARCGCAVRRACRAARPTPRSGSAMRCGPSAACSARR